MFGTILYLIKCRCNSQQKLEDVPYNQVIHSTGRREKLSFSIETLHIALIILALIPFMNRLAGLYHLFLHLQ